ncbi:MAG: hypothetical protein KIT72_18195 [Polyangiaceae bacterium]|nr:hypothetical protein [Polyangiaceae bacterium]MCW5792348.1 hypothetical protein [Polyangiaceae bacterium]
MMLDTEPEQVCGEVAATVDDRRVRFIVVGVSVALVAALWFFAYGSTEGTVVAVVVSAAAALLVALFLGYGWRLLLTTEGMYYTKRTRLFGPYVVLTSIPIARLATVRHWRESRRSSDGRSSYFTVGVIQVRNTDGRGFRVTGQHLSQSQLMALERALGARGITMELLASAPS